MSAIAVSLAGGVFFLMLCLLLPARADQSDAVNQIPRWVQFPLAYYPSLFTDVYKNFFVWSEYGGDDSYPFTCALANNNTLHHSPPFTLSLDYSAHLPPFGMTNNRILPRQPTPPDIKWDICLYEAQTGQITHVTDTGAQDQWPRIHGNWIAFSRGSISNRRIIARNLTTGQETELPHGFATETPNIHSDVVVYFDAIGVQSVPSDRILAYDLTTQELMTITYSPNPTFEYSHVYFPDVYSRTVVWQQSPPANQDYDIIGYDLNNQTFFTISDKTGNEQHPRIDGNLVVWDWQGDIYGYNLASGQRLTITQDSWTQIWPAVSGSLVVWMDYRNGRWDIYGYDLALAEAYWLTENASGDAFIPAVWGNLAAWDHYLGGAVGARKMTDFVFLPITARLWSQEK